MRIGVRFILATLLPIQLYIVSKLHAISCDYSAVPSFLFEAHDRRTLHPPLLSPITTKDNEPDAKRTEKTNAPAPNDDTTTMPWIRLRDSKEEEDAEDDPPLDIRVAVATVPRKDDVPYLRHTLESLRDQGFPQEKVSVYFHSPPPQQQGARLPRHKRWNQAARQFPNVTFYRNQALAPQAHPAIYAKGPLRKYFSASVIDAHLRQAHEDTLSRKEWRRKECWDFVHMMQHQLHLIIPEAMSQLTDFLSYDHWWESNKVFWKDPDVLESKLTQEERSRLNSTILIFNEDDALWKESYKELQNLLDMPPLQEYYDFHGTGTQAWGFRGDALYFLVLSAAPQWCDFKPVDWVLQDYFQYQSRGAKMKAPIRKPSMHRYVEHVGKVSSMIGRVDGTDENQDRLQEMREGTGKPNRMRWAAIKNVRKALLDKKRAQRATRKQNQKRVKQAEKVTRDNPKMVAQKGHSQML